MATSRQWTDTDVELVARAVHDHACMGSGCSWSEEERECDLGEFTGFAEAVLEALTAAGWEARCDCSAVVHDLPILRSHIRGEPGCEAARLVPEEVATGEAAGPATPRDEVRRVAYEDPQHVLDDIAQYERDEDVEKLGDLTRKLLADLERARGR